MKKLQSWARTSVLCSHIQAGSLLTEELHADAGVARSREQRLHATCLAITMLQEAAEEESYVRNPGACEVQSL